MNDEKDILTIWKERIKKESKHGDKRKACDTSGKALGTYQNAMRKEKFDELTNGEQKILQSLMEILDKRKADKQKIKEQYVNN